MRGGPAQPLDEVLAAAGVLERARELHGATPAPGASPSAPPEPAPNSPGDAGYLDQEQLARGVAAPAGSPAPAGEPPPRVHRCTTCPAPIYWAQLVDERGERTGKPMPVDAEPSDRGNIVLFRKRGAGRTVFARVLKKGETPPHGARLRTSHFATCLNAKHHRRNR